MAKKHAMAVQHQDKVNEKRAVYERIQGNACRVDHMYAERAYLS